MSFTSVVLVSTGSLDGFFFIKHTARTTKIKNPATDPITIPAIAPELRDGLELELEVELLGLLDGAKLGVEVGDALHTVNV